MQGMILLLFHGYLNTKAVQALNRLITALLREWSMTLSPRHFLSIVCETPLAEITEKHAFGCSTAAVAWSSPFKDWQMA